MAKKARKRKAGKRRRATGGKKFSLVGLHTKVRETIERLKSAPNTPKKNELDALVKKFLADTDCRQTMLIEL